MRGGWKEWRLGDVADIGAGNSAPQNKECFVNGDMPFIRTSDVGQIRVGSISDSRDKLNGACTRKMRLVDKGSILVPKSGASTFLNHRVVLARNAYVSSHLATVKAKPEYALGAFLHYFLITVRAQDLIQDHKYPSLKLSDISDIRISLPSLPEQKRIVAILDEALAGIATAVSNTEKNLANARELLESYLDAVFSQRSGGWTKVNFGLIADFKNGLNYTKSSSGERVRVVGVKDFKSNYWAPIDTLETVQVDGQLTPAYELNKNDIVIVRSNGNKQLIGRCLLVGELREKTSHSGFTIRARLKTSELHPEFLAHYLRTSCIRERLIASGDGANISSLNQRALATLPVSYPAKDNQITVLRGVQEIDAASKRLEFNCQQKLVALTELKQSLLQTAFSGELTTAPQKEIETALA